MFLPELLDTLGVSGNSGLVLDLRAGGSWLLGVSSKRSKSGMKTGHGNTGSNK